MKKMLMLVMMTAALAFGQIVYVDQNAPGMNNGMDWFNAFTTLQPAIDAAFPGMQVWVAQGTYLPTSDHGMMPYDPRNLHFRMKNMVEIYGGFAGWESSIGQRDIDGNETILSGDIWMPGDNSDNSYHVFYHPETMMQPLDPTAVLDGFTIRDGNADGMMFPDQSKGGGMFNQDAHPTIRNCRFKENYAWMDGGGMYNEMSDPIIVSCRFYENNAGMNGGGMANYMNSNPNIADSDFYDNEAQESGGGIINWDSSPTITASRIYNNEAMMYGGGLMNMNSSPVIVNTTITENTAMGHGGGHYESGADPGTVMKNCLIFGNTSGQGNQGFVEGSSLTKINCTIAGPGGYFIDSGSVTAYNVILAPRDPSDLSPVLEISGGTYSMFHSLYQNMPGDILDHSGIGFTADGNCITGDPMFADFDNNDFRLVSTSPCVDTGENSYNDTHFDIRGEDRVQNDIIDMGAYEWTAGLDPLGPEPAIYFVKADASGDDDGSDWENAFVLLQSALTAAQPKDQIWVAAGTYYPTSDHGWSIGSRGNHFRMKEGVEIYGGFDGTESELSERDFRSNETILSGDIGLPGVSSDNSYHVIYNPPGHNIDKSSLLDGFTVRDGFADGSDPRFNGGGIYNHHSDPTIRNCRVIYNTANNFGGGIYNDHSSPMIVNTVIAHNKADNGGGLYNFTSSDLLMVNCLIYDNEAENVSSMVNYASEVTRISCTIQEKMPVTKSKDSNINNTGPFSQSISNIRDYICVLAEPDTTVVEVILTDESSTHESTLSRVPEFYLNELNFVNNGCIFDNPMFVDEDNFDFRLFGTSPLIDVGLNEYNEEPYDIRGQARIQGGIIDIGAFEFTLGIDPETLGVPQNLTVTFEGDDREIEWNIVNYADYYRIFRSDDPYSGFEEIGTSHTNSYTDEYPVTGNKYFYYVIAVKE